MLNILTDPLIRINAAGSTYPASLPETYAALIDDKIDAFPALRPHQRHAWHAFLVQLGAMAMHRDGRTTPPSDAAEWLRVIRALTPDYPDDEPWQLVVDDITEPAFMQPPASSKDREKDYKFPARTPDDLDVLETSKNHDLKSAVAKQSDYDDWLISLVSVQTHGGRSDRYYQGISRMKGSGYSRTAFSVSTCKSDWSYRFGLHLKRDVTVLTEQWESFIAAIPDIFNVSTGHKLLWTIKWDGTTRETVSPNALHPLYIEICRRIRLRQDVNSHLYSRKATSRDASRIEANSLKGQIGDPWTAVDTNGEALGLRANGFSYRRIVDCFDGTKYRLPFLCNPTESEKQADIRVSLVTRGIARFSEGPRSTTAGYYERVIPLRHRAVQVFGKRSGVQELGDIARKRIGDIGKIQDILRCAIVSFATQGNRDRTNKILHSRPRDNPLRKKVDEWVDKLDKIVDARFFDDLQTEFEAKESERQSIRNKWLRNGKNGVTDHARTLLNDALDTLPCPALRRYRARANAEGLFEGRLCGNTGLPFLFDNNKKE